MKYEQLSSEEKEQIRIQCVFKWGVQRSILEDSILNSSLLPEQKKEIYHLAVIAATTSDMKEIFESFCKFMFESHEVFVGQHIWKVFLVDQCFSTKDPNEFLYNNWNNKTSLYQFGFESDVDEALKTFQTNSLIEGTKECLEIDNYCLKNAAMGCKLVVYKAVGKNMTHSRLMKYSDIFDPGGQGSSFDFVKELVLD